MSRNDVIEGLRSRVTTTTMLGLSLVLASEAVTILEVGAGGGVGP